jgi:hypothetical protein
VPEPPAALGELFDLMAALNESVSTSEGSSRRERPADVHELPKTTKRTARKGPGKEAAARKLAPSS